MTDTIWQECPMPGCCDVHKPEFCCCRRCWRGLPAAIRAEIMTTWRELQKMLRTPANRFLGRNRRADMKAAIGAYRMAVETGREFYARRRGRALTA
jgi:hypothetical protein